jgi:hypothetical protein
MIVLVSLFICLIPKIFTSIDPEADSSEGASGVAGILWPICYMSGSVSKSEDKYREFETLHIARNFRHAWLP